MQLRHSSLVFVSIHAFTSNDPMRVSLILCSLKLVAAIYNINCAFRKVPYFLSSLSVYWVNMVRSQQASKELSLTPLTYLLAEMLLASNTRLYGAPFVKKIIYNKFVTFFAYLEIIIIKFPYNARSDWLKQRRLSENKVQVNDIKLAFKFLLRNFDKFDPN